jgi:O-methyltransferase
MNVKEKFGTQWGQPELTDRAFDLAAFRSRYFEILDEDFWRICQKCYPYTLLSLERMYDLYQSVRYVCDARVPGDLVECGVLLGGSVMLMAEALLAAGDRQRRIYVYDTFRGFTGHTPEDLDFSGSRFGDWSVESFRPDTEANLRLVDFPFERYELVEGPVEETIPTVAPDRAALLRLDTDTYPTTRLELELLYPRLSPGGVLVVDDYGFCLGCRKAVDEYFAGRGEAFLLHRIDYTGRSGVKR